MAKSRGRDERLLVRVSPAFLTRLDAFVAGVREANPGESLTREDAIEGLMLDGVARLEELLERARRET